MKIKALFSLMKKANEFADLVGENPYIMWVSLDGYYGAKFYDWREFEDYVKNEYTEGYCSALLSQNIELDSKGCADCYFECDTPTTPYDGKRCQSSIQLAISRKE